MFSIKTTIILFSFVFCAHAVKFNCNFKDYSWPPLNTKYTCEPTVILDSSEITNAITGTHLRFLQIFWTYKNNGDVLAFYVYGQKTFNRIPRGIERFFNNLEVLSWCNGLLTTIEDEDLKPFTKLIFLQLKYNKLIALDGDLFKHTPNMQVVSFALNVLELVDQGLLTKLTKLFYANFGYNPCINIFADTSDSMQYLKLQLQKQCPGECSVECSRRVDSLEENVLLKNSDFLLVQESNAKQNRTISLQSLVISELQTMTSQQDNEIAGLLSEDAVMKTNISQLQKDIGESNSGHDARIAELETQNSALTINISQLQKELEDSNSNYEARIVELEMLVRELN